MARLVSIPGVGRKTAERMLLDLQEKAQKVQARGALPRIDLRPADGITEDVVSALVNLGYKKNQAEKAVESVLRQAPEITLEKALRESLKVLSAG
jgi:Holliday junction DNA helicase RuvA